MTDTSNPKSSVRRPNGRPTKYDKKYCKEIVTYFDQPLTYKEIVEKFYKGAVIQVEVERITDLPTFERFAHQIGVTMSTMWEWKNAHEEFSNAYSTAQSLQEQLIVGNAMAGRYVGPFAQFYLKNKHKYTDRQELTGADGASLMPIGLDSAVLSRMKDRGTTPPVAKEDSGQ